MNLIDRDALILAICDIPMKFQTEDGEYVAINNAITVVENAPTIDAVPVVHGKWIREVNPYNDITYRCSSCSQDWWADNWSRWNYCPNCGAWMYVRRG